MTVTQLLFLHVLLLLPKLPYISAYHKSEDMPRGVSRKLSKPLIGEDGRIYGCSGNNFFAFENNGTIAWSLHLDYQCNLSMAPVHGGYGKIYLVAENRILMINFGSTQTSEPVAEIFFGPEHGENREIVIIGVSVSTLSSTVFINMKNRGLFAYRYNGSLRWSVGPVLYHYSYRQGCKKNLTDCYFASVPMLDQCEASIYISNTEGELYCLSIRNHEFRWIQDLSSLDKVFSITPGNNGHVYITIPVRTLVLALDAFSGNILWQRSIGPLSKADSAPVVDTNGWVSIGSLDGFLYSFSPNGVLKKFSNRNTENSVVQVSPFLDCSGFAIYYSQIDMEGKVSHSISDYTIVSAIRPKAALFTMLVPATGSMYWFESYTGQFLTSLSKSDLSKFVVDEEIIVAFLVASNTGNPLQCRTIDQRLTSSCSQARTVHVNIYTGNERAILLFLLFESTLLVVLAALVRFCFTFWTKKKLQAQGIGSFLDKRRSLRHRKKAFDRTITELEQKASKEEVGNEVFEKLGDIVRERECIERKLSSMYSLGRDKTHSQSKSLLPLHKGKTKAKRYSFKDANESVAIFHTVSDTCSSESSIEEEIRMVEGMDLSTKAKGKKPMVEDSSSSDI
ncbi:PREDICTED: protein GAMETE EXPRESSED 3 [Lupinus angustifolius]|uniref:protein GAMETE EXPRESSED 3 n=1 Tax=Lupinus angustifolius TaxID=3871 RepID=UPI00092F05AD|nr:PREDICTED: protein GAMETE EXPRESSED 3 [Lupinus angustifolius]